ncbi:MAG: VWA domain-containing protein [Xanthomonadales bacterium]|nr:VWA domain-containing protein [Xanthomonadales bacterium]
MAKFRPLPLVSALSAVLLLNACVRTGEKTDEPSVQITLHDNVSKDELFVGESELSVDDGAAAAAEPVLAPRQEMDGRLRSEVAAPERRIAAPPASAPKPVAMTSGITAGGYATGPADRLGLEQPTDTERYADMKPNPVIAVSDDPVSTFSVDVDTGAYSNARRFLAGGRLPPTDAVRVEEFINYFDYDYPIPTDQRTPFTVSTELALTPWNADRWLLQVGLKGFEVPHAQLPASNLVFLLDVSGSMNSPDKLPLVKAAMHKLTEQMRPQDRVAIVVYAGAAGLVLPSTGGDQKDLILGALNALQAGGSTNGGQGIQLAYQVARENMIPGGVNRVILATDGDFNVGTVNQQALEDLVSRERKSGIALTTLGFGQGNYNDHLAERLADLGDGNHAYIDTEREAQKVLVDELSANLLTIAKDVKIQIEFNPAVVAEYRLIGYENRLLAREDFNNDAVDAGEIGAGHTVTALYELTPVGSSAARLPDLRYGSNAVKAANANELGFLKLRYKYPQAEQSELITQAIATPQQLGSGSSQIQFAAAVAAFGEALRGGKYLDGFGYAEIAELAQLNRGADPYGLRGELVELIGRAEQLGGGSQSDQVAIAR